MVYYENSKYQSEHTADQYDKYLPEYYFLDEENREYIEEKIMIEKKLSGENFKSVLELGVGSGRVTELLMSKAKQYTGIDISESMIKKIEQRFYMKKCQFEVFDINDFLNENLENLKQYDFIGSFWAFNYAILSFFEYQDLCTGKVYAVDDLVKAEELAKEHFEKVFNNLNKGTKFLFVYFDAYSVEQAYVTSVLEWILPSPYNDRGFTFKLFNNLLCNLDNVEVTHEYKNGFVILSDDEHLIGYFSNLHLKGYLEDSEAIELLVNNFRAYRYEDGHYEIPAGVNLLYGHITM